MIGIIEYGAGNLFSLTATLRRLDLSFELISHPKDISNSKFSHFIVPGVGHAQSAKNKLLEYQLWEVIPTITRPVLGICVGMQMLSQFSEEGNVGLWGIIPADTTRFPNDGLHKVPHIGWNSVHFAMQHAIFDGIKDGSYFYFVHSYCVAETKKNTLATTNYVNNFSAAVFNRNFIGVQFHPEKSGDVGAKLLSNFSKI